MIPNRFRFSLLVGAALLAAPMVAMAQDAAKADDEAKQLDKVIVTGTAVDRTAHGTPLSVNTLDDAELRTFAGSGSQADILQQIPGLKPEGGGGEVATNLFVRGLPTPGQLQFTPINYDGITVLSNSGLNSSAIDFFARNDLGIERLEFVKGGVSNLFGVSSTAGVINYISKTGTDEEQGTLQLELSDENRVRGDFAFQGPINDNTFYAVSGFYRYDEGPIFTGQPTEGFALRGNILREFADGSGKFQLFGSYINDRVNFYLPIPLDGSSRERVAGNDGAEVFNTNQAQINGRTVPTPEGLTQFSSDDGFSTVGGTVAAALQKDLGEGWGIDAKIKYSDYDSTSDFFNNGVGPAAPETQAQFTARNNLVGSVVFTDVESGAVLAPTDLVYNSGFNNRDRPTTDGTVEVNLTKEMSVGEVDHTFTLGTFIGRAQSTEDTRSVQFLSGFNAIPNLVDVTVGGQQFTVGGITRGTSGYAYRDRSAFTRAIYFADQIDAGRWQFDIGARIEEQTIENRVEINGTFPSTLATTPVPGSPITTLSFGTGQFNDGDATATAWALAGGVLYELNDTVNLYANASRGFFFPQAQGTNGQIATVGDIEVFDEEPIVQAEAGAKFRTSRFDGSVAAFYVGLRDRNAVSFVGANLTPTLTATETDTIGIEFDGRFAFNEYLTVFGNVTFQESEYVGGSNAGILGNSIQRNPDVYGNVGASFDYANFDGTFSWTYNGDTFQDAGNGTPLDAYSFARGELGYSFGVGDDGEDTMRLSVGVWNIFDSQGLAEGNPRAGVIQSGLTGGQFFNGRPILPRRVTARLTYDF
ncbi:MAG: TonB-dependent receptor [Henriciella sp.]